MTGKIWAHILITTFLGSAVVLAQDNAVEPPPTAIVISVAEQKLALVKDGGLVRKFPISTSKFGLGDSYNSYKTPLGRLRVCDKIGDNLAYGAVLKSRNATGEILPVNSPGRDPIVTRILWLDGLEPGNSNARSRGIYIHGTVEESRLGQPVSYGCIRMSSRDVVELFEETPVGTPVEIITERLPRFRKATPKSETLFASNNTTTTVFGPRGLVTVRTVRGGGEPQMAAKGASTRSLFPESTRDSAPSVQIAANKATETSEKLTAEASRPLAQMPAPNVTHTPPPAAEPMVVLSLKGSILDSGLSRTAKAPPAPTPEPEVETPPPVQPEEPRNVVLQEVETPDLFASAEEASRQLPLDRLSLHLLHPPTPQFRLAFRNSLPTPEL